MSTFIDLLRQHRHELEQDYGHHFNSDIKRAISAMLRCKTEKQGLSQWYCSHCHHDDRLTLSCGNRHCPQCQHRTTSDWLERQKSKLLPVHYYMVTLGNYCRVKSYPVSYTQYQNYLPVYAPEIISIRVSRCLLDVYKLLFKINTITKVTAVWDSVKYPIRTYPRSMADIDGLKEFAEYRDAMLVFDFSNEKYSTKIPAFAYRALLVASEEFKTFSISSDDRSHFIGNVTDKAGRSKRYLVHNGNKGYLFEVINETSDSVDKLVGSDKWVEVLKNDGWKFYNDK